jgi:hypothetical protein
MKIQSKEEIIQNIKLNRYVKLPQKYLMDYNFIIEILNLNGMYLESLSEELKNNKEIVMVAINNNADALLYASCDLRNNKEVVLSAVSISGHVLEYASKKMQDDKEIVKTAASNYGYALEYASKELRSDKDVAIVALTRNVYALDLLNKTLQNDKDILLLVKKLNEKMNGKYALIDKEWFDEKMQVLETYREREIIESSVIKQNKYQNKKGLKF